MVGPPRDIESPKATNREPLLLLSNREAKWLLVGALVFAAITIYPLFCDDRVIGPVFAGWLNKWPHFRFIDPVPADGDRDVFMELRWVPYYTMVHFHQLPFWNPYKCGGMSLIANPESSVVTPFLLFYVLFGLSSGVVFEIYFHLAIAFAGGYVLGRELGLRTIACVVLAGMFPSSSWLSLHIGAGHLNFLSAGFTAWILALFLASVRMRLWYPALLGGLVCGLTLAEGNYGFVFSVMLVGILAAFLSTTRLSVRPLLAAGILVASALAFAALKLIPTAELLRIYPRDWGLSYHEWIRGIVPSLFSRNQDLTREPVASFFFSEYGGYISAPFVLLALIGAFCGRLRSVPWILGAWLFLLMYRGDTSTYAPTMLLRLLPLGGNIGLCGRWVIPLVFCVGMLAALGAHHLAALFGSWGPRLAFLLVGIGLIDAWIVCAPNYRYLFHSWYISPPAASEFTQSWGDGVGGMTAVNQANYGALRCTCCAYYIPRGSVRALNQASYRGEYYLLGEGTLKQIEWTPNQLRYTVDTPAATSLIVNQNNYPGWRLIAGTGQLYGYDGLIAVRIPPGRQEIEIKYMPRGFALALTVTLLAFVVLCAVWMFETGRLLLFRNNYLS